MHLLWQIRQPCLHGHLAAISGPFRTAGRFLSESAITNQAVRRELSGGGPLAESAAVPTRLLGAWPVLVHRPRNTSLNQHLAGALASTPGTSTASRLTLCPPRAQPFLFLPHSHPTLHLARTCFRRLQPRLSPAWSCWSSGHPLLAMQRQVLLPVSTVRSMERHDGARAAVPTKPEGCLQARQGRWQIRPAFDLPVHEKPKSCASWRALAVDLPHLHP